MVEVEVGGGEGKEKAKWEVLRENGSVTTVADAATDTTMAKSAADAAISDAATEPDAAIVRPEAVQEVVLVEAVIVVAALAEPALTVAVPAAVAALAEAAIEESVSVVPSTEAITLDVALAADAVTETATATEDGRVRLWLCGPGGSSGASA